MSTNLGLSKEVVFDIASFEKRILSSTNTKLHPEEVELQVVFLNYDFNMPWEINYYSVNKQFKQDTYVRGRREELYGINYLFSAYTRIRIVKNHDGSHSIFTAKEEFLRHIKILKYLQSIGVNVDNVFTKRGHTELMHSFDYSLMSMFENFTDLKLHIINLYHTCKALTNKRLLNKELDKFLTLSSTLQGIILEERKDKNSGTSYIIVSQSYTREDFLKQHKNIVSVFPPQTKNDELFNNLKLVIQDEYTETDLLEYKIELLEHYEFLYGIGKDDQVKYILLLEKYLFLTFTLECYYHHINKKETTKGRSIYA